MQILFLLDNNSINHYSDCYIIVTKVNILHFPIFSYHPHMLHHLSSLISQIPPHTLLDIRGGDMQLRNGDVHYPFRQDSDFLYLTGLSVPGLRLTSLDGETILWREPITEIDKIW